MLTQELRRIMMMHSAITSPAICMMSVVKYYNTTVHLSSNEKSGSILLWWIKDKEYKTLNSLSLLDRSHFVCHTITSQP